MTTGIINTISPMIGDSLRIVRVRPEDAYKLQGTEFSPCYLVDKGRPDQACAGIPIEYDPSENAITALPIHRLERLQGPVLTYQEPGTGARFMAVG